MKLSRFLTVIKNAARRLTYVFGYCSVGVAKANPEDAQKADAVHEAVRVSFGIFVLVDAQNEPCV